MAVVSGWACRDSFVLLVVGFWSRLAFAEHLHLLGNALQLASLLAIGFPGVELQAAFDKNR